jgi:hypothetical protein
MLYNGGTIMLEGIKWIMDLDNGMDNLDNYPWINGLPKSTQNSIESKPKIFCSDRAAEYLSDKMQSYLAKEGIKFQCTVGYANEQNGIAERKNRTLVEAARTVSATF